MACALPRQRCDWIDAEEQNVYFQPLARLPFSVAPDREITVSNKWTARCQLDSLQTALLDREDATHFAMTLGYEATDPSVAKIADWLNDGEGVLDPETWLQVKAAWQELLLQQLGEDNPTLLSDEMTRPQKRFNAPFTRADSWIKLQPTGSQTHDLAVHVADVQPSQSGVRMLHRDRVSGHIGSYTAFAPQLAKKTGEEDGPWRASVGAQTARVPQAPDATARNPPDLDRTTQLSQGWSQNYCNSPGVALSVASLNDKFSTLAGEDPVNLIKTWLNMEAAMKRGFKPPSQSQTSAVGV